MSEDPPKCPECGRVGDDLDTAIRQSKDRPWLVDVGWRCSGCQWEWGFDLSEPSRGTAHVYICRCNAEFKRGADLDRHQEEAHGLVVKEVTREGLRILGVRGDGR